MHHAMKIYGEVWLNVLLSAALCEWVVSLTLQPLYRQGKWERYTLDRELGGPSVVAMIAIPVHTGNTAMGVNHAVWKITENTQNYDTRQLNADPVLVGSGASEPTYLNVYEEAEGNISTIAWNKLLDTIRVPINLWRFFSLSPNMCLGNIWQFCYFDQVNFHVRSHREWRMLHMYDRTVYTDLNFCKYICKYVLVSRNLLSLTWAFIQTLFSSSSFKYMLMKSR